MMTTQPTSGSQVISDRTGNRRRCDSSVLVPGSAEDADQRDDADQHGEGIDGERAGLDPDRLPRAVTASASASPFGTPSMSVASPVCQSNVPSAKAGRTKIASYSSSKYHLFSRNRYMPPKLLRQADRQQRVRDIHHIGQGDASHGEDRRRAAQRSGSCSSRSITWLSGPTKMLPSRTPASPRR